MNHRRKAASQRLKEKFGIDYKPSTLAKAAVVGGGPPFYVDGRFPLYPDDELEKWAIARLGKLRRSTSDRASLIKAGTENTEDEIVAIARSQPSSDADDGTR